MLEWSEMQGWDQGELGVGRAHFISIWQGKILSLEKNTLGTEDVWLGEEFWIRWK